MNKEIETIIKCEEGVRVSISDYDQGVWLHLGMRHGTACAVLNRAEAEQLLAGLQAILEKEIA